MGPASRRMNESVRPSVCFFRCGYASLKGMSVRALFVKVVEICGLNWSERCESPRKGEQQPILPLSNGSRICWSCTRPCIWDMILLGRIWSIWYVHVVQETLRRMAVRPIIHYHKRPWARGRAIEKFVASCRFWHWSIECRQFLFPPWPPKQIVILAHNDASWMAQNVS